MLDAFIFEDATKCGTIKKSDFRVICKAFKLPLPEDVLHILVNEYVP